MSLEVKLISVIPLIVVAIIDIHQRL